MKITARVFAATALLAALVAGCGDDDPTSPDATAFNFTFSGLPKLATGQHYEAWVTFPGDSAAGRALHGGDERVSLGTFAVTQSGAIEALTGGPASFSYDGEHDLQHAENVMISVETEGDTAHGPVLIAGIVEGDEAEGRTTLDIGHHDAVGTNFATAAGTFILATPTDGPDTNETQGIWFTDSAGTPSLTLPTLGEGWIYHAHVFHGGHSKSVGTFSATNVEDSDGRGPDAGPSPGFPAPGSDFLASALELADGTASAYIVIQPSGDEHEGAARSLHDQSFPMRVLETTIAAGATPRQSIALGARVAPWPEATVSFAR